MVPIPSATKLENPPATDQASHPMCRTKTTYRSTPESTRTPTYRLAQAQMSTRTPNARRATASSAVRRNPILPGTKPLLQIASTRVAPPARHELRIHDSRSKTTAVSSGAASDTALHGIATATWSGPRTRAGPGKSPRYPEAQKLLITQNPCHRPTYRHAAECRIVLQHPHNAGDTAKLQRVIPHLHRMAQETSDTDTIQQP